MDQLSTVALARTKEISSLLGNATTHEIYINNMIGKTLHQKLQNALDIDTGKRHKVVVAPPEEIVLSSTLKIPSHTTLVLYGTKLKLGDGVNDRIVTNSDHISGNEHIYILGYGDAVLDGNKAKQTTPAAPAYKNIGVHLYKVKNCEVRNITIANTKKWSFVPEAVEHALFSNIVFDLEGDINQDGIHILGPSNDIIVDGIRGTVGDDACVINARPSTGGLGEYQGYGTGGSITGVTFNNVNIKGMSTDGKSHTSILRTSLGGSNIIKGITLSNAVGDNILSIARLGGDALTTVETMSDITIDTVHVLSGFNEEFGQGIHVLRDIGKLTIRNISTAKNGRMVLIDNFPFGWQAPANIDGLTIEGCSLKTGIAPSANDFLVKFKGGSVKNTKIDLIADGVVDGMVGYSGIWVKDTMLDNVEFNVILSDMISVMKTEGTTLMNNVRLNYNANNIIGNAFDLAVAKGLSIKGNLLEKVYKPSGETLGTVEHFKSVIEGTLRFTNSGTNPTGVLLRKSPVIELRTGKTMVIEGEGKFFAGSGITWFAREAPDVIAYSKVFQGYTLYLGGSSIILYTGNINGMGTPIGTFTSTLDFANIHKIRITHTDAGVVTINLNGNQVIQTTNTAANAGLFGIHTQASGTVELSRLEFAHI